MASHKRGRAPCVIHSMGYCWAAVVLWFGCYCPTVRQLLPHGWVAVVSQFGSHYPTVRLLLSHGWDAVVPWLGCCCSPGSCCAELVQADGLDGACSLTGQASCGVRLLDLAVPHTHQVSAHATRQVSSGTGTTRPHVCHTPRAWNRTKLLCRSLVRGGRVRKVAFTGEEKQEQCICPCFCLVNKLVPCQ